MPNEVARLRAEEEAPKRRKLFEKDEAKDDDKEAAAEPQTVARCQRV